jgi:Glutathione S-transferase, N-terminal domain
MRRHDEGGELETKEPRMTITMYDLAGAEADRRFSPFCWRSKMALAHKGPAVETVPWRFTEKDKLPQPNAGRVPVIIDGDRVVHDSTVIAEYLEERYPDRPSLFGGAAGRALARFVQSWTETVLQTGLIRLVMLDIHRHCAQQDQAYFRHSREERFSATLKKCRARPASTAASLPHQPRPAAPHRRTAGFPVWEAARPMPITSSSAPWARAISDLEVLAAGDPIGAWRGRMLDLFDGLARRAPAYGD